MDDEGYHGEQRRIVDRGARHRHNKTRVYTALGVLALLFGPVGIPVWNYALHPALVRSVSVAMADELDDKIQKTVREEIAPIKGEVTAGNAGLKVIIRGTITDLEEQISALEYVRDFLPGQWTDMSRQELVRKNRAIATQRAALAAIENAENTG